MRLRRHKTKKYDDLKPDSWFRPSIKYFDGLLNRKPSFDLQGTPSARNRTKNPVLTYKESQVQEIGLKKSVQSSLNSEVSFFVGNLGYIGK